MNIRPATKEDLLACKSLVNVEELRFADGSFADEAFLALLLDENYFLVAEDEGAIVGCVLGEPLRIAGVMLWMITVSSDVRGKGVGKALMGAFEDNCRKQKQQFIYLNGLDSSQHERFYTSLGYTKGKKLVEYVKEPLL